MGRRGAPNPIRNAISQIAAAYYFLHFLVILPLVSAFETPLPLPRSISDSVFFTGKKKKPRRYGQSARAPRRLRRRPSKKTGDTCRYILGFIGAVFALVLFISLISGVATYVQSPPAPLASDVFHKPPKELHLASDGPLGKFDRRQLQRGFQVYSEVCSACHSLKLVSFRDLKGLGYDDAEVKKIASDWKQQVPSINPDTGEEATRKALPSDTFPPPFANETAARAANNNALPPRSFADHKGPSWRRCLRLFDPDQDFSPSQPNF